MKISPAGMALILQFEGFSPTAYRCPAGWWTIGYGHVLRLGEAPMVLDEAAAQALLTEDVSRVEKAMLRLIRTPLTQPQWDALVSFTYNLGAGALQRSRLRQLVNRGEHPAVPAELMRWVWGGGRILPGLIRRRAAEAALYRA